MKKAIVLFFFCTTAFSFSIQLVDKNSEHIDETIAEILKVQQTLLLPLELTEIPSCAQSGFLTVQMTPQYLIEFLQTGRFLIAVHQDQIVGYLLLDQIEQYLHWAEGKRFDSEWDLQTLQTMGYIDQIAVAREFAKQGVGTALINSAKKLSERGLLTDILSAPYRNEASLRFFTARGFANIGTMYIEQTATSPPHATAVMLWLPSTEH